jgi:MFS family permease
LRLLYLALGATTAFLSPFIAVILQERGFDPGTIGVISALAAAGFIAVVPVWGHIGDAILGRRLTLALCMAIATAVALGIAAPIGGIALALLVIAFGLSMGAGLGLTDSLAVGVLKDPRRDYGRVRMLASLAFAVAAVLIGPLYDLTGYGVASALFVVGALAIFGALAITPGTASHRGAGSNPAHATAPSLPRASGTRFGSTGVAFAVAPKLAGVLVAVTFVWFAVIVSFTFLSLRIVALGGQASDVAFSFGISAFAEVPGILLAARLARRVGLRGLFSVGALGYAAVFLSWTVLATPGAIVVTRLLTGVCYGGMTVAMVLTIGEMLPARLQSTGQSLYQGTATGVAAVIGNLIGGQLYDRAGFPFLCLVCVVTAIVGAGIGWLTLPKRAAAVAIGAAEMDELLVPSGPLV